MRCSCGQGHETFGACMRAKNIRVGYCQSARGLDLTAERGKERELAAYKDARRQGIQPASTFARDINDAVELSDRAGTAFDAGAGLPPLEG